MISLKIKMNILILGSDSFISQKFIKNIGGLNTIGISKVPTISPFEIHCPDFFKIEEKYFAGKNVVINFAAIVHRPELKEDRIYDEINHKLAVLNAYKAKKAGVKLFIQMSTIAVYGNTSVISINTTCNPLNPYSRSKLMADEALLEMEDENFKVAIVRPPMVYGGGRAPGNMMRLIILANKGFPLPFKGINNKRDFINVNNLVQYLAIIAEKKLEGVHLITDNEPVSSEYLLKTISKYLGKSVPQFCIPLIGQKLLQKIRPNEYEKLFGSLNIQTNFPFEANIKRFPIEEGIAEMVVWYKNQKKGM